MNIEDYNNIIDNLIDNVIDNPIISCKYIYFILYYNNISIILKLLHSKDNTIYIEDFINDSNIKLYGKKILLLFLEKIKIKYPNIVYIKLVANSIIGVCDKIEKKYKTISYNDDIIIKIIKNYSSSNILSDSKNIDYLYCLKIYETTDILVNYYEKNYRFERVYNKTYELFPSSVKMFANINNIIYI